MYFDMVIPLEGDYYPLEADFFYFPLWDIYFDTNSDGEVIQPSQFTPAYLSFIGIQKYSTYYDISYPAMVKIADKTAFKLDGFIFMFMLEGNIRANSPLKIGYTALSSPGEVHVNTLMCDIEKRNSAVNYSIYLNNSLTGEGVTNTQVSYTCGTESCMLGLTDNDGILVTKLPICFGGSLNVEKFDYISRSYSLSTSINPPERIEEVVIDFVPLVEMEIKVGKKEFGKITEGTWHMNHNAFNLDTDTEELTIIMERQKDE